MYTKTIKGFEPHTGQQQILQGVIGTKKKYHLVCAGRQVGKTLLAENLCLFWAYNDGPAYIGYLTPTYKLAKTIFEEIVDAAPAGALKANKSDLTIEFTGTKSKLSFWSMERYDTIRGQKFTHLICDEFSFYHQDAWQLAIRATTIARGKKVVFITTPKGKNHFHKLWLLAKSKPLLYATYQFPTSMNPIISKEELEAIRSEVPEEVWLQEFMAEFLDGTGAVFKDFVKTMTGQERMPRKGERVFFGVDIGQASDYTVLTLVNEQKEVLLQRRWRKLDFEDMLTEVAAVLAPSGSSATGYVEQNGVGAMPLEDLQRKLRKAGVRVHGFITTNDSKQDMVDNLRLAFQRGDIVLPVPNLKRKDDVYDNLKTELESFAAGISKSGRKVVYAAIAGMKDDAVMSLGLCLQAYEDFKGAGGRKFGVV